jgi:general secretion pathway protein I
MRARRGFTLIEVVVSIVIIAVGFAAVSRATGLATDALGISRDKTLAMWAARNRLAEYKTMGAWPEPGEKQGGVSFGKAAFFITEVVTQTPSPHFRKVTIRITRNRKDDYVLAKLTGYLLNENANYETQAQ